MIHQWFTSWLNRLSINEDRWVVVDVETTGLDQSSDELLCIGAVALRRNRSGWALDLADHFEVLIRPDTPSASEVNILLHGIGWGAQQGGESRQAALEAFTKWVGDSMLIAFHSDFDRTFLERAHRLEKLPIPFWHWMDLAHVLPCAFPSESAESLDEWMRQLNVHCFQRHRAIADVWATAQLFLKAAAALEERKSHRATDWMKFAKEGRWLRRIQSNR